MTVALRSVTKSFGSLARPVVALDEVSLDVREGELLVVVGPSGSGKSTLLRCIAGLEEVDRGSVEVAGRDVTDLPPGGRDVAMVFQEHALYPHLDVRTNIAFPLLARKLGDEEVGTRVGVVARMLDLEPLLERRPTELSGGERRRVALGRAVIREPAAFLMDEPLASLDVTLKLRVLEEIRSLQRRTAVTSLYVTHDQTEALGLGDRIAVMRAGRIEQVGPADEVYERPLNTFVASFIGRTPMNILPGGIVGDRTATVGLRPEACNLVPEGSGVVDGVVRSFEFLGANVLVEVASAGARLRVEVPRREAPPLGSPVGVAVDSRDVLRFDDRGQLL